MFETLNTNALSELANVGERSVFKKTTSLGELVACIEQAEKECQREALMQEDGMGDRQQLAEGFRAAQQILVAWWAASESGLTS